jgi:hypothetical protein
MDETGIVLDHKPMKVQNLCGVRQVETKKWQPLSQPLMLMEGSL